MRGREGSESERREGERGETDTAKTETDKKKRETERETKTERESTAFHRTRFVDYTCAAIMQSQLRLAYDRALAGRCPRLRHHSEQGAGGGVLRRRPPIRLRRCAAPPLHGKDPPLSSTWPTMIN